MTATAIRTPAATAAAGSTVAVALRLMLRLTGWWLRALLAFTMLGFAVAHAALAIWGTPTPIWAAAGWVANWAGIGFGVALGGVMPLLVTQGLTRRTAHRAGTLAALALAVGYAGWVQVGLLLELAAFTAAGLPYGVDASHMFTSVTQVHLVLPEYGLAFAGFLVSGWLAYVCYQRIGRWATLALPLIAAPGAGTWLLLSTAWTGGSPDDLRWVASVSPPVAVGLATAVVAAGLLAIRGLTRTAPVRIS